MMTAGVGVVTAPRPQARPAMSRPRTALKSMVEKRFLFISFSQIRSAYHEVVTRII